MFDILGFFRRKELMGQKKFPYLAAKNNATYGKRIWYTYVCDVEMNAKYPDT